MSEKDQESVQDFSEFSKTDQLQKEPEANSQECEHQESEKSLLKGLLTKIDSLEDRLLRSNAELQNMQKRSIEDIGKARKFSIDNFASDILGVVDSLESAIGITNVNLDQTVEGVKATLNQLSHVLESNSIKRVETKRGDIFDPHIHQAISTVPTSKKELSNSICEVLQKGYMIHDRVLRPCLVTVFTGDATKYT